MKTKKEEVIFCVGLIIVLINAVSSKLLITTDDLKFIPEYKNIPVQGDVGKPLVYTPINYDNPFHVYYAVAPRSEDEIRSINFNAGTDTLKHSWMRKELWYGRPGIEVKQGEGDQRTFPKYTFVGIEISLQNIGGTSHDLMNIQLKFFDLTGQRALTVDTKIIEKPTTEEDLWKAIGKDVYNCRKFKSFQELMKNIDNGQILVNMPDDFPWIKKVLNRAKFMGINANYPNVDWYYAGAFMVNPDIITGILQLDTRWKISSF